MFSLICAWINRWVNNVIWDAIVPIITSLKCCPQYAYNSGRVRAIQVTLRLDVKLAKDTLQLTLKCPLSVMYFEKITLLQCNCVCYDYDRTSPHWNYASWGPFYLEVGYISAVITTWISNYTHVNMRQIVQGLATHLTHWGQDKMDDLWQTIFSKQFSSMKIYEFSQIVHWGLFLRCNRVQCKKK